MKLSEELKLLAEEKAKKRGPIVANKMKEFAQSLIELQVSKKTLQIGEKIPILELTDPFGGIVTVNPDDLNNPLVLVFYRGQWCPYCNLTLRYYQNHLGAIKKKDARLLAISPQTSDNSLSTKEKHSLEFEVLSDIDNTLARKFGLVFKLNKDMIHIYKNSGYDLTEVNGSNKFELPIPATFVIDKNGVVRARHVDTDYTKRMDVEDILEALDKI
jgi:peroxiredoxin